MWRLYPVRSTSHDWIKHKSDRLAPYTLRHQLSASKDLYDLWGERIVDALNAALLEVEASALVNLASEEYFKSVLSKKLAVPVIQPVFEDWSGSDGAGKFKVVSFYAKRTRG